MDRRTFLSVPLLALAPSAASPRDHGISELRFGGTGPDTVARARALQARLGITVRPVQLDPAALAKAMHAGQIEFATLGSTAHRDAHALMGARLAGGPDGAMLHSLPPALRQDLEAALAAA